MSKRIALISALVAVVALAASALALGGSGGLIFDDGHYVRPGTLDDGKQGMPKGTVIYSSSMVTGVVDVVGQVSGH